MVDLHIHSTASDGTLTPEEVVRVAVRKGLTAISVADHDTVAGSSAARAAARGTGLEVIPGIEISTQDGRRELHLLGYFVDYGDAELQDALARARGARQERIREMVVRLQGLGVRVALEDVARHASGGAWGRPHLAAALVSAGVVREPQEAFQRYLRRGRPAFVDRWKLPTCDAIALIRGAGGIAVFAHPGLCDYDGEIKRFVECGLEGLEAYHVDQSPAQTERYIRLARALGLVVTGGTDSHGPAGPTPVEIGQVAVPDSCAEELRDRFERSGRQVGR